jgi:RsiW-degrading membrane proteinase PrsW (M82 family)
MNNFELIAFVFKTYPFEAIFSILLVSVPIAVWIFIFTRKEKESKSVIALTFLVGMGSAMIMFLYQQFWEQELNFGFFELKPVNFQSNFAGMAQNQILSIFLVAISIGLIEEYLKHWVVKKADHNFFRSVDDVIELSIIAALGFAFLENIIYLFREILSGGISHQFFTLFFLRSLFVVFVHILCSGVYGYYYGVGYYAAPILEEEKHEGKTEWIPHILHKLIHFKESRIFHDEMVTLGLIISVAIHGLFDFFMSVNWTIGSITGITSLNHIGIHVIILPLYLILGFGYLAHLLDKKEDHEKFGRLSMKEVYIK